MIEFKGFPTRMQFTPIPNLVFSSLLPRITDITELKVLLCIFEIIYPKKGSLRYVSFFELMGHTSLMSVLKESPQEVLRRSLEALLEKGAILHLAMDAEATAEDLYFLNTESNRMAIEKIRSGEIRLPGFKSVQPLPVNPEEPSDIFTLYEQNIGMLTPLIADELREAGKQYPEEWIRDAIKEAAALNKRNWRYIARILEHWLAEGKDDGTYRGNLKKNTDPDKYIKGRYGHMVQR
jgi:DNA replication protein